MLMKNKYKTGVFNKSLIYIIAGRNYTRIYDELKSAKISLMKLGLTKLKKLHILKL
jgi:hypothetical protein